MYFCLGPFEGCLILIPTRHKSFDCFDQHADAGEVSALQGATAQDAKPAFNLIEPGAVSGNKVKMHIGMGFEPAVLLGLVSVEIVQDYVELLAGIVGNQLIHEIQDLTPAAAKRMSGMYQPASHVEGCKESRGSMAFVLVSKAGQCPAVGQADPALGPFQSLNAGFFVYAEHQGIFGRMQIESDHIGRLTAELRISAQAPALPALKMQVVLAHHTPDLVLAYLAWMLGNQAPVPAPVPPRRRPIHPFPSAPSN